jgi:glycosyltransferase involved in cell wall biosynthesis
MSKIKILVAPGDRAGSGKYRCVDPHVNLQNNFSNEYFVDINYNIDFNDFNYLKKYDIIFIHRIPQHRHREAVDIIKNIKKLGIKVIIDTDDYWELDPSHGLYHVSKREKLASILIECMKLADLVTVPTSILANEVKKYNKNVAVLANALDPNEEQFKPKPTESEMIRFGWLGGSSHLKDIELLRDLGSGQINISDKMQIVLCGFDTRGTVQFLNKDTNEVQERPMKPEETTWFMYELFLTNNYRNLQDDKEYLSHLVTFTDNPTFDTTNKRYRRIWTKPINQYAIGYNEFDIAMAPLKDSSFNKYKSQLKVIEAGFHKKAIIAQNYGPYTIDLISGINKGGSLNPNGNCLLVESSKNHKQWSKFAKKLVDNPEMVKDLGEKLYETVMEKYDLNIVTKERDFYYKNLVK